MIIFRADATTALGIGHVARCLALADVLIARGCHVRFQTKAPSDSLRAQLTNRGVELCGPGDDQLASAQWLIVDHYDLGLDWERHARHHVERVMVIDDLARSHDCDVLLDQNPHDDASDRYAGKVPATCRTLFGLHYALLRSELARHRTGPRSGPIRSILVSFGGTDPPNETMKVLQALRGRDLTVRVLATDLNPHLSDLEREDVSLHVNAPNVAELLATSDLVIGAVGGSTWERFCVGVPSIAAALTPSQEPVAITLARRGLHRYVGRSTETSVATYAAVLDEVIADPSPSQKMAIAASLLVDGRGAERVADVLLESS